MILGNEVGAPARICYYAQELSLLMARPAMDLQSIVQSKDQLDQAFRELIQQLQEDHELN